MTDADTLSVDLVALRDHGRRVELLLVAGPADDAAIVALRRTLARARGQALEAHLAAAGWPTTPAGAKAALDLVASAERDVEFLRRCSAAIEAAHAAGAVPAWHVACVTDLLELAERGTQRYGTRLRWVDGRWEPLRIAAPEAVDQRRSAVGLEPLAQVLARRNRPRPAEPIPPSEASSAQPTRADRRSAGPNGG